MPHKESNGLMGWLKNLLGLAPTQPAKPPAVQARTPVANSQNRQSVKPSMEPGATAPAPSVAAPKAALKVPDENSPVWELIAEGRHELKTKNLGLQMLLMRAAFRYARVPTSDERRQIASEIRSYFIKYAPMLRPELEALSN